MKDTVSWTYALEEEITDQLGLVGNVDKIGLLRKIIYEFFSTHFLEFKNSYTITTKELNTFGTERVLDIKNRALNLLFASVADELYKRREGLNSNFSWKETDFGEELKVEIIVGVRYPMWESTRQKINGNFKFVGEEK